MTRQEIQNMLDNGYRDNDILANARGEISHLGASLFSLASVIATTILTIALVIAIVKLSGSPQKRAESKESIVRILFAAACVFGILTIVDFIGYIVQSGLK